MGRWGGVLAPRCSRSHGWARKMRWRSSLMSCR
uniref:Uncharacterized protein n=1 Tax=Zea mays TaxID=4577 RepID=B4FCH7_MAIZE|nr:unknown [Zea mays]